MYSVEHFNGEAIAVALSAADAIIQRALGIRTSTFNKANSLYAFEQLPQPLLHKEVENKNEDLRSRTKEFHPEMMISQAHRWVTDEEFGRYILNGVNPVVIHKCSIIPDNIPVTNDMIRHLLMGNMSQRIQDEIKVCRNIGLSHRCVLTTVENN